MGDAKHNKRMSTQILPGMYLEEVKDAYKWRKPH